jgi:putative phosphoribosyl transferase
MIFADRTDAGRQLAERLRHLAGEPVTVLGIPRGGIPVAAEVAKALDAPLDLIAVRKLGVPSQPELAMGAVGEDDVLVFNDEAIRMARVGVSEVAEVELRAREELEDRLCRFREAVPRLPLDGRTAVVVDDGIATGSTARAACQLARAHGARRVVLATPVAPSGWTERLSDSADELVAVSTPEDFNAVGQFYADFSPTTEDEAVMCLWQSRERSAGSSHGGAGHDRAPLHEEVEIDAGPVRLTGNLTIPESALGLVVFAHGSGSSRHSPRNRFVAERLHRCHLGTLLLDLLTSDEDGFRANVFDVGLLARRLTDATHWLRRQPRVGEMSIGYFGASTGAAAALAASIQPEMSIAAVVSRGGRPDLLGDRLAQVVSPTLLIVGSLDDKVVELNRWAQARLSGPSRLEVVDGASHLFEEGDTLETAADLACEWFLEHMRVSSSATSAR